MDWRRDDTGYAAAAVGAVGFVAYLLAANFGLIPSPIGGIDGAPPAAAAIAIPAGTAGSSASDLPAVAATPAPAVVEPSPLAAAPGDSVPPEVAFSTEDGARFGITDPATVTGRAGDLGSGVDRVNVTFTSGSEQKTVRALVSCDGGARRDCTWSAEAPSVLADYDVTAEATDRAGNVGEAAPIAVQVVNTGRTVRQAGETVGRVPSALDKAVDGLLGFVGGSG